MPTKSIPFADLYSPAAVAEHLGVNVETVRRWIRSGRLRSVKIGRQHRIRQEDLAHFLRTETEGT